MSEVVEKVKFKKALSVSEVENAKFKELNFTGEWLKAIGRPEKTGCWLIMGPPKNGKTTFCMMAAKYLAGFERVFYNSVEEGLSKTMQTAYKRVGMSEVAGQVLMQQDTIEEFEARLDAHKSPHFAFLDSVQFANLSIEEYKRFKEKYRNKILIYVSHVIGKQPDGSTAQFIMRDANVVCRVEGRRAFIETRYEGDGYIDIHKEFADKYWLGQSK